MEEEQVEQMQDLKQVERQVLVDLVPQEHQVMDLLVVIMQLIIEVEEVEVLVHHQVHQEVQVIFLEVMVVQV